MLLRTLAFIVLILLHGVDVSAQQSKSYKAPLTEHGQPDFQTIWSTAFLTDLERPDHVASLIVSPKQAREMADNILAGIPELRDPDDYFGVHSLAKVNGEFRTSIIVEPFNGKLPYTQLGLELASQTGKDFFQGFDHPEQRPLNERCMGGLAEAPLRTIPIMFYYQFIQTRNHVVLNSEDPVRYRIIHLNREMPEQAIPSLNGHSVGHWDGATLVVDTSHFRSDYPARMNIGRPVLIGEDTWITERFTRVSETELHYGYSVKDESFYTQQWAGEFSLTYDKGPIFEYACHEGNYSMPGILLGGRRQASEN